MKMLLNRFFGGLKGIFFLLLIAVGLALHLYTQRIVTKLRSEARSMVQFYAGMYARIGDTDSPDDISFIFDQIIRKTHFPLIQTDADRNPVGWKGLSISPDDTSAAALHAVERMVRQMERQIDPVPVTYGDYVLGYLYYGDSRMIQQLRWLPTIEMGILGLFILAGFIGYANIKRSEQRHIWVGMAKETAHQLGTPISSIMGWLEVMRSRQDQGGDTICDELEKDLNRLERVSKRFSQIGSRPDLKKGDLAGLLKEVTAYIRRRAPQMGRRVTISEQLDRVPPVALNAELFGWAVENILKNSLDAMDKDKGNVDVRLGEDAQSNLVWIEIADNGRGMEPAQARRIFRPGFSTKKRGWGLGLTLARRIIAEYHGGKVFVKETRPKEGTTIRIELKV